MGIRESLEKYGEQDLNLKNLSLEQEEEQGSDFDIEKEAEKYYEEMKNDLEECRRLNRWEAFLYIASDLKILFPDKINEFGFDQTAWQEVIRLTQGEGQNTSRFLKFISLQKFLFPDYFKKNNLDEEEIWQKQKRKLDRVHQDNWTDFFHYNYDLKILFPNKNQNLVYNFDDTDKKEIEDIFKNIDNLKDLIYETAYLKVVFPDFDLKKIGINKKFWNSVKKGLREVSPFNKAMILSRCKILAAEEVRITDQGLELVMPEKKQFKPEKLQRPERREY